MNSSVALFDAGLVVESWWYEIESRFPGTRLDELIVMPNHLHGIVSFGADPDVRLEHSLSDVLYWYKSITTHEYALGVRQFNWPPFPGRLWQKGFYDHVIRGDHELSRIREYIRDNPRRWQQDELNRSPKGA
jgi:REP element-mobilizing transposase RayT